MSLIREITRAIKKEPLHIRVLGDEIIFEIYENSVPIVLSRKTEKLGFRIAYLEDETEAAEFSCDMLSEVVEVMKIIEEHKEEILEW
ncbi:MAG: hypothetical protein RR365_10790 [Bacteroides sp.]